MEQKFYIRQNKITLGPFDRQTLKTLFDQGKLTIQDEASTDKTIWQSLQNVLGFQQPETAEQPVPRPPEPIPAVPVRNDGCIDLDAEDFPQKLKFGDLLLTVIAALGNGGGYLHRLSQYSNNTMLAAGITAAILSLLAGAAGCLLFGSCYNASTTALGIRCLTGILLSGVLIWGGNAILRQIVNPGKSRNAAEADFLAGMHAMLNISIISIVLNGSLFVFNRVLFSMSAGQTAAVMTTALLPLIFFSANTILSLRMNFMGSCKLSPGVASLMAILYFYAAVNVSVLPLYTIYDLT